MTISSETLLNICAVDVGSNSVKMRVCQIEGNTRTVLQEMRYPIRLGASVFSAGRLDTGVIQVTCAAFEEIERIAESHQVTRYRAVATSAAREAVNGLQLCEAIRLRTGWDLEIISGNEEARLVALGLRSEFKPDHTNIILDVGGGSTELIINPADGGRPQVSSIPLGAVRLRELTDSKTPPSESELTHLHSLVSTALLAAKLRKVEGAVYTLGVAGTIKVIAEILAVHFNGSEGKLQLDDLERLINRLPTQTEADIVARYEIDTARAQILLPGAIIVYQIMKRMDIASLTISSGGVRDGILEELMQEEGMAHESAYVRIGTKYQFERHHEAHVAALATSIFEQLKPMHRLGAEWLICLQAAAWLHDIGQFISYTKHHKHSWYLIMNEALPEALHRYQSAIACIARYHRKAHPQPDHPELMATPESYRGPAAMCAAILRIADAFDRRHLQMVKGCEVKVQPNKIKFILTASDRVSEERAAFTKKSTLLAELFDREIIVEVRETAHAN